MSPPVAAAPVSTALAGLCALALGMGIGRFAYTPVLPWLRADVGLSIEAAGLIASANFAGYLAGALLAIRVPAAGRRRAFAGALLTSVATTLLMALLAGPWPIGAARFVSGVASAFILIHGSAIVLDALARAGRPALFSLLYAGVGTGIALTALLVEAAARAGAGNTALWLVLGSAAALLMLPALGLRDEAPSVSGAAASPARASSTASRRALAWLTAAYGGLGIGYVITATFLVVMVRARADWRPYEMLVWLAVGLAAAPSNYLWLRAMQRFGPWRAMIAAYLLEAAGVAAAASATSLGLVLAGAVLLGGTFMGITALGLTTARGLTSEASGPVIARMTAAFGAGQIVGPTLGAWLAERTGGFGLPSAVAAATLVASAVMVAVAARHAAARR